MRAFLHRRHRILDAAVGGHHDDRQLGIDLLGGPEHAEAVALGSRRSDRTTAGLFLLQRRHGLGLIARFDDGVPLRLERMPQHRPQGVLVLDDENLGGQRTQPAGTPARRASSSMSAICLVPFAISWSRRASSASAF